MPGTTLPRTVRTAVRIATIALWVTVPVAAFAWDVRLLIVALALAAVGTGAWGFLYLADQNDKSMRLVRQSFDARQDMLVRVIEQMACGPAPEPETSPLRVAS